MAFIPGISGQKTELFDGAKVDTLDEYTAGNGVQQKGRTSGVAVSAGYVGEVVEVKQTALTNFPTSTQWGDLGSVTLTAGIWQLGMHVQGNNNGATSSFIAAGIGTVSGNSNTGLTYGDTVAAQAGPGAAGDCTVTITNVIKNISTTTIFYAKVYSNYSAGTPQYRGRLTAIRIA